MKLMTEMSTDFVAAENLTKCYGKRTALNGLSLAVKAGEVIGLLGPNGAGKTTALSILATILRPHSGRASICGHRTLAARASADTTSSGTRMPRVPISAWSRSQ